MSKHNLKEAAAARLAAAGIPTPELDARLLLAHANQDEELFNSFIARRLQAEPVAYIIGFKGFWMRDFIVTPDVLIPRPDTETLIEVVKKLYPADAALEFLELGIGSGCISISLLDEFPNARADGVDKSEAALKVAAKNAIDLTERLNVQYSDWFQDLPAKQYNFIISNPPYITAEAMTGLQTDVKNYEPHLALTPGATGLESYRAIAVGAANFLKAYGRVIVEIGQNQEEDVAEVFAAHSFELESMHKDLGGINRCLVFKALQKA